MGDRFELGHIHPTNQSGQSSVVSVVGKCVNRVVMFLVVIRRRRDLFPNVFYESRPSSRIFHSSQIGPRRPPPPSPRRAEFGDRRPSFRRRIVGLRARLTPRASNGPQRNLGKTNLEV